MKSLFLGTLLTVAVLVASSESGLTQSPDEVLVGPLTYQQDVNGIPVSINARSYLKIVTNDDKIELKARILADLFDLQNRIGTIVDTFSLPNNNCAHFGPDNPVVSLSKKELAFRAGAALFEVAGTVTMWECAKNPVPNSKVEWEASTVGSGLVTKVPVVHSWPGNPIKTSLITQPFDASLPIYLVKANDNTVGLQLSRPDIELEGRYAFITKGILNVAGIDINQKAYDALIKAIDPQKLMLTLPPEVSKANPVIEGARFFDDSGHLSAEISASAVITPQTVTDLISELIKKKP